MNQQSIEQEEHDLHISESELWELNENQLNSDHDIADITGNQGLAGLDLDKEPVEEYLPRIPMRRLPASIEDLSAITLNEVQLRDVPTSPLMLRRQNAIMPIHVSYRPLI